MKLKRRIKLKQASWLLALLLGALEISCEVNVAVRNQRGARATRGGGGLSP